MTRSRTGRRQLAAPTLTPVLTNRREDIEQLADRRAVVVKALADLPTVARELGDVEGDIANSAGELGWADTRIAWVTAALSSPVLRADLAAHLKRHGPLALAAEAARRELRNKDAEVARLTDQPADLPDATSAARNTASRGYRRIDFDVIPALPRAETKTACAKAGH